MRRHTAKEDKTIIIRFADSNILTVIITTQIRIATTITTITTITITIIEQATITIEVVRTTMIIGVAVEDHNVERFVEDAAVITRAGQDSQQHLMCHPVRRHHRRLERVSIVADQDIYNRIADNCRDNR